MSSPYIYEEFKHGTDQPETSGRCFVCGCNGGSGYCCSVCATERRSDPGKTSRSLHARPWIVSMTFTETSETRWLRPSRSETLIFTTVGFGCVSSHHTTAVVRRDTPQSEAPLTSESNSAAQTNGGLRNAGFDQAASDCRLPSLLEYRRFCELSCRVMYCAMSASVKHNSVDSSALFVVKSSTIFSNAIGAAS